MKASPNATQRRLVRSLAVDWLHDVLTTGFDPSAVMMLVGAMTVADEVAFMCNRHDPAFVHHLRSFALDAMRAHRRVA